MNSVSDDRRIACFNARKSCGAGYNRPASVRVGFEIL